MLYAILTARVIFTEKTSLDVLFKAHIPLEMGFALATQRKWNLQTKKWNVHGQRKKFAFGPNATYIPLTGVGGWRRG